MNFIVSIIRGVGSLFAGVFSLIEIAGSESKSKNITKKLAGRSASRRLGRKFKGFGF